MATSLVTTNYRNYSSKALIAALSSVKECQSIYFFYGDHTSESVKDIDETYYGINIDPYHNMIAGKKVNANDVSLVVKNNPYVLNQVWDMYNHDDKFLKDKKFFTIVDEGAYSHVYKCLDNNMGAKSTVQPAFSDIQGANTFLYQTSDGYRWKYMYSVSSAVVSKFSTADFFPLGSNTTVSAAAVAGALDIIEIEDGGRGYNNYLYGAFSGSDVKINGNNVLYAISTAGAPNSNGYFTGCMIYLADGSGAGQYTTIRDYFCDNTGKYIVLSQAFPIEPTNGTHFQITPEIKVLGDGAQTSNAKVRALVNALASNSIYRAEVLNRGKGYSYFTGYAVANSVVGVIKPADLRPVYSPTKGHGSDPGTELFSNSVMITVSLIGNESNTIPAVNEYHQIGFIRNPTFANVTIQLSTPFGSFLPNESVVSITTSKYYSNVVTVAGNTTISCANVDFTKSFSANQMVFLSTANGNQSQLATINSVTNASHVVLKSPALFSTNSITISTAVAVSNAVVSAVLTQNTITLTNCQPTFNVGDYIVGKTTGTTGTISLITISDQAKQFSTFVQLNKYKGTAQNGVLQENETVYQEALNVANAALFSAAVVNSQTIIYTSNQVGSFLTGVNLVGNTSGAIVTITDKYPGELNFGSGETLYLENISPVQRSSNTETYKFVFEF